MTFVAEQARMVPPEETAPSSDGEGWIVSMLAAALSGAGPS
jgi:hypothetical protein